MDLERLERLPLLKKRPADSHKGMYGSVLVIAGSRGMAGAAALVGASALRSGAGLVRIACPAEVQPTVATFEPSYMTYPLPQDVEGQIDHDFAREAIARLTATADVLAVGPGLGQSAGLRQLLLELVEHEGPPLVLDADALNNLVGQVRALADRRRPTVITPHPGEFARLIGKPTAEVQADREGLAVEFARSHGVVVILKGHQSIVTDGRRVHTNITGNPGMATGGVGDCLTGVVAALIGQGLDPFDAAALGAHVHGLAGDVARDQNGEVGLIAGDIVDSLPDAFEHLGTAD